jgi:hypothetical protein
VESGEWRVESGEWRVESGKKKKYFVCVERKVIHSLFSVKGKKI